MSGDAVRDSGAPALRGVLLTVAYDGSAFSGLARQDNARSVAGEIEGAIAVVDPRATHIRAASRTDAGVHARGQVLCFDTHADIAPRGWVLALTQELPREIAIVGAARVEAGYDPRRRALRKTYRYVVLRSPVHDPFWWCRAWRVYERLNQQAMRAELEALRGEHDFRAFRSSKDQRIDTTRVITRATLEALDSDPRCLVLEVEGNRFMHRMMRIICGTLVDVGRGRVAPGAVQRALTSGDRDDLGMTAPPDGLYLERVVLDEAGNDPWPPPHLD